MEEAMGLQSKVLIVEKELTNLTTKYIEEVDWIFEITYENCMKKHKIENDSVTSEKKLQRLLRMAQVLVITLKGLPNPMLWACLLFG